MNAPADFLANLSPRAQHVLTRTISALFSVALHATVTAFFVLLTAATFELDSPGEGTVGDHPVGNDGGEVPYEAPSEPVQVSLYVPPPPNQSASPRNAPTPEAAPTEPQPSTEGATATDAAPPTDGAANSNGKARKSGVAGKPPRGKKKPCEPIEEVVKLDAFKFRVERDLVDWYATHLRELEKQAGVGPHKGPDGKRDGARLYLPRCSVLKQGGLRSGDVIHTVNGRPVTTVAQAVKVYLLVRGARKIKVDLTRKNGRSITIRYKLN